MRKMLSWFLCFAIIDMVLITTAAAGNKASPPSFSTRQQQQAVFDQVVQKYCSAQTTTDPAQAKIAYDQAVKSWQKLADDGNFVATKMLAEHYLHFQQNEVGLQRAIVLYEKAAKMTRTKEEVENIKGNLAGARMALLLTIAKSTATKSTGSANAIPIKPTRPTGSASINPPAKTAG